MGTLTSTNNLYFEQEYEKYQNFYLKIFLFLVVKFSIYLNRRVFVMTRENGPVRVLECNKLINDTFKLYTWTLHVFLDLLANTYGRGVGRIPDKKPCPEGLRDDGVSCWSDAHIYGKGCCCTLWGCCHNCRAGYHDDGCTCRKTDVGIKVTLGQRQICPEGYEKYGLLCYPKCVEGYVAAGCCVCKRINPV